MDLKKWIPWNWFKKEEEAAGKVVPVKDGNSAEQRSDLVHPLMKFHRDMNKMFSEAFRGFEMAPFGLHQPLFPRLANDMLKPTLDLGASEKEYNITVEIPGVDEKDVKLEIVNDTLTIRGEKKQEKEEKEKNYYRVERSYGSFQRMLSLPEDADQDGVKATFKNGILTITLPRKALPESTVKKIEVNKD